MDIQTLRSIVTLISFVTFIGIVVWAYSRGRKAAFDEAAQLVFDDEDAIIRSSAAKHGGK